MAQKPNHGGDDTLADAVILVAQSLRQLTRAMTKVTGRLLGIAILETTALCHLVVEQRTVCQAEIERRAVRDGHGEPLHPKGPIHISRIAIH